MRLKDDVQTKLDYEFLEIKNKAYIWLSDILIFFHSTPFFEEFFPLYKKFNLEMLYNIYKATEKEILVHQTLDDISNLLSEVEKYQKYIDYLNKQITSFNNLEINIAHGCNLRCGYCLAGDGTHGKTKYMSEIEAKAAIDFLLTNAQDSRNLYIAIIGGEPLLNMSVFKYILQYASECGKTLGKQIHFTTTVNGTLLTPEVLEVLDKYQVKIMLSLDSHIAEINDQLRPLANGKGSYQMIMDNGWKSLLTHPSSKAIRMTVTPENLHFFQTAKIYFEAGFYHVHIEEVVSDQQRFQFTHEQKNLLKGEYEKLADYLVEKIAKGDNLSCHPLMDHLLNIHQRKPKINHCGALKNSLGISPDLEFYPCDTMMWEKYKVGSFQEGINPDEILEKVSQSRQKHCAKCWARHLCGQGCLLKHLKAVTEMEDLDCELTLHKFMLEVYIYGELMTRRPDYLVNLSPMEGI